MAYGKRLFTLVHKNNTDKESVTFCRSGHYCAGSWSGLLASTLTYTFF